MNESHDSDEHFQLYGGTVYKYMIIEGEGEKTSTIRYLFKDSEESEYKKKKLSLEVLNIGSHHTTVDAHDKAVLPGFVDAHGHWLLWCLFHVQANLNPPIINLESTIEMKDYNTAYLINQLKEFREKHSLLGQDILPMYPGWGYDDTLCNATYGEDGKIEKYGKFITKKELSDFDHRAYICHISSHMGNANQKMLDAWGIGPRIGPGNKYELPNGVKEPFFSTVGPCPDTYSGESDGLIKEAGHHYYSTEESQKFCIAALTELLGQSAASKENVFAKARMEYLSRGVTTVNDGAAPAALADNYGLLIQRKFYLTSTVLYDEIVDPHDENGDSRFQAFVKGRGLSWPPSKNKSEASKGVYRKLFGDFIEEKGWNGHDNHVNRIKLIFDGSIQGRSAALNENYLDTEDSGFLKYTDEKACEILYDMEACNVPISCHCNGDRAIKQFLDAVQQAREELNFENPTEHVVIHCQTCPDEYFLRMKQLKVRPSLFPEHIYYWGRRHKDIFLGKERGNGIANTRLALDLGLRPSIHQDAPVIPVHPFRLASAAVNRLSYEGDLLNPDSKDLRVSIKEALLCMTKYAAEQELVDDKFGSLELGKVGNFLILDKDPFFVENTQIENVKVYETYVDGLKKFPFDDAAVVKETLSRTQLEEIIPALLSRGPRPCNCC